MARIAVGFGRVVAVALAAAAGGCGGPAMVPVEGGVTLDGKPLPNAIIGFYSVEDPGRTSNGFTDASGRFRMRTMSPGDGVPPGEYKVTVEHWSAADGPADKKTYSDPVAAQRAAAAAPPATKPAPLVPPVYSSYTRTPLTVTVPVDGDVMLELRSGAGS